MTGWRRFAEHVSGIAGHRAEAHTWRLIELAISFLKYLLPFSMLNTTHDDNMRPDPPGVHLQKGVERAARAAPWALAERSRSSRGACETGPATQRKTELDPTTGVACPGYSVRYRLERFRQNLVQRKLGVYIFVDLANDSTAAVSKKGE